MKGKKMIKQRTKPIRLQKLEALLPRLNPRIPKYAELEEEFAKRLAGYLGEKKVDYHLETISHQVLNLPDVNLRQNGRNFQIDHFLISPHATYIIETKNFQGTITFDTVYKQLIRDDGQKETGFRYPITQVEMQKLKLQEWFRAHKLPEIPIYHFIAISHPSTIIKVKGDDTSVRFVVAHAENIPIMIMEREKQLLKNNSPIIPHHQIGRTIATHGKEPTFDILSTYNIHTKDIKPGVCCPHCNTLAMKRIYNNWFCPKCKGKSRHAHKAALRDYFLLIQPWISNKIGRYWLNIPSKDVVTRLFTNEKFIRHPERRIWIPPK